MKKIGFIVTSLALASGGAVALPVDGAFAVSASFSPSTVAAGGSTTFTWGAAVGAFCDVDGLPGGTLSGRNGSYTFVATAPVTAYVSCERNDVFSGKSATLNVTDVRPTATASFAPSTVYVGGAPSTLSWSSTQATNCTSAQVPGVAGTSGSIAVPPAASPSSQTVTVTCAGPTGSASTDATLATVPAVAPASVTVFVNPSYLSAPNFVNVTYTAQNVTSCQGGGQYFIAQSTWFGVQCDAPGGTVAGYAWARVYRPWPFSNFAPTPPMSKDGKTAMAAPKALSLPVNLKHLGIDLSKKRYEYVESDMNRDGVRDLLVVDKLKQQAYIVLGKGGQYPAISKTVEKIATISQIKSVFVPVSNAPGEIRVTLESQQ